MKKLLCMLLCSLSCAAMQNPLRFLRFDINHINALNPTGEIQIAIDGGVSPYTYVIGNFVRTNVPIKTILAPGLPAGNQQIRITDSMNNTVNASIQIRNNTGAPPALGLSVNRIDVGNVTSGSNGSLNIEAGAIAGPENDPDYSINNGASFQELGNFSNLTPEIYNLVVQLSIATAVNWIGTVPLILVGTAPVISVQTTPADCISGKGGTITITVTSGGIPPFKYSIDGGKTFSDNNRFTNVPAGTYQIVVVDNAQNSASTQATVDAIRGETNNAITNLITKKYCKGKCTPS